jgi:hypothetical protein
MIKLKTLLEIQMIAEALPLSVARDFVSIQRNPKIKAQMDVIMNFLKKQPNVIVSRNGSRIAIPLRVEANDTGNYNSEELQDFVRLLTAITARAEKYMDGQPIWISAQNVVTGRFEDQYRRTVKPAKFIQSIVSIFYKNEPVRPPDVDGSWWVDELLQPIRDKYDAIPNISDRIKQLVQDLLKQYDSIVEVDAYRSNKPRDYYMIFSTHAYDIAGMSTGRGFGSCMNLYMDGGTKGKRFIQADIEQGTIISYLVLQNDLNIERPVARILIKPYINTEDPNDVLYDPDPEYGTAPDLYFTTVYNLVDKAQPGKAGRFSLVGELYCDNETRDRDSIIDK